MKEIVIKHENAEQATKEKLLKKKTEEKNEVKLEKDNVIFKKEGNCFALKEERGFKVSFKERLDQGEVLTLNKSDHLLKMNFLGKKSRMKRAINALGKVTQDKITYEDIEQGVNLSYQCLDNKIKECVVIKEKQDSYDYDFTIDIGDLTPRFDEKENSLELLKDDKVVYRILSPFMEDKNGQRSEDCSYEIEENNGKLNITLHCDSNWINSKEKAFPVVVDPTIEVVDNELMQMTSIVNFDRSPSSAGKFPIGIVRTSESSTYANNYKVEIVIKKEILEPYKNAQFLRLVLYVAEKPANCPNAAWIYIGGLGTETRLLLQSIQGEIRVDLTEANKRLKNEDMVLTFNYLGDTMTGNSFKIYTIYAKKEFKPRLEIGIKNRKEYVTYDCGENDITKFSVENGLYRHIHNEGSIKAHDLNINLTHIYDSLSADLNEIHLGKGWRTNLHQYLFKNIYYDDSGNNKIHYVDGEGNNIEFRERWYYLDENDEKHYVRKKQIFLDLDQKLKAKVNDEVFEIKYEVENDDGLTYVSGNNISNFNSVNSNNKYHLAIEFGDGETLNVTDSYGDGKISVPHFREYYEDAEADILFQDIMYKTMTSIHGFAVKEVGKEIYEIKSDDKGLYFVNKYSINGQNKEQKIYLKLIWDLIGYDDIDGIFVNEDIQKIDAQIKENKMNIKSQYVSIMSMIETVENTNEQINCQSEIMDLDLYKKHQEQFNNFYKENGWGNKALKKSLEELVDKIEYDSSNDILHLESGNNIDTIINGTKDKEGYHNVISLISNYLQNINNRLSIATEEIKKRYADRELSSDLKLAIRQLDTYKAQIENSLSVISESEKQLENLKKQRELLVEEQKKQVNDLIVDKEGSTLGFDGYGRLILIQDKYENKINIEFGYEDENKGKMLSIYSDSQTIKFNYDKEAGLLSSMIDAQGRKTKYEYDNNQNLIQIKSNNGEKTKFKYESGFKVSSPSYKETEIICNTDNTIDVRTNCCKKNINCATRLTDKEETTEISNQHYVFNSDKTLIEDKTNGKSFSNYFDEEGHCFKKEDEKHTSICFKNGKSSKFEAYLNNNDSFLGLLTFTDDALISIDLLELKKNKQLPSSNILMVQFTINDSFVGKYFELAVLAEVHSDDKVNAIQQYYTKMPKCIYFPIFIDPFRSNQVDVWIKTVDDRYDDTFFTDIKLMRVESGKMYLYDEDNRLIQEQDGYSTIKYLEFNEKDKPLIKEESNIYGEVVTTAYHYDAKDQLTYAEDSKQNVIEYFYDDKGNCIEKRSYNKKDASLMQVEKVAYDEHGNMVSSQGKIKDVNGNYPKEEATYLPGTNIQSRVRGVNGDSVCYQYDQNTGDLLSISSSAQGINNSTSFTYNYGLLTSMSHHGVKVDYEYDGQGRKTKVSLNGEDVLWNTYEDNHTSGYKDLFTNTAVAEGQRISYLTSTALDGLFVESYFDEEGKEAFKQYSSNDSFGATKWTYNDKNQLTSVISQIEYKASGETYIEEVINTIDEWDTVIKKEKKVNDVSSVILEDHYDDYHRFVSDSDVILSEDEYRMNTKNSYDEDNHLKSIQLREGTVGDTSEDNLSLVAKMSFDYDVLGRVKHQNLNANKVDICHEYSYLQQDENTLDLIAEDITKVKIQNDNQTTYLTETSTYEYDVNGNIIAIEQDENKTRYQYDSLNRLIREDNPLLNKTIVYKYDKAGNILLKKTYDYSLNDNLYSSKVDEYIYDCEKRDRLISFNGKSLEYDKTGRPTTYKDDEYEWNNQNQLTNILKQNEDTIEYFYDTNGIRRKKIVNGVETTFITNGSQILAMKQGNTVMIFRYILNKLVGFNYNVGSSSKEYIYQRNIQGDIIGIFDDNGTFVGGYAYDGYGNHIITQDVDKIASLNPFRYRGYFFDNETKLYYLNSRYYDTETGRFISPDTLSILDETRGQINGLNLYMYCKDNPIMNYDPTGHFPWLLLAAAILLFTPVGGAALQVATSTFSYIGIAIASIFDEDIRNDMNAIRWNPFNADESATLKSRKVSFYKGSPVFRTASNRSGTFAAIFLQKDANADTLRHERGHNWQLTMMGIANYALMIGLPSWQEWSNRPYYERPWEITADIFGGVTGRTHSQHDINRGYWYLAVSSLFGPLGYFFLFGEY